MVVKRRTLIQNLAAAMSSSLSMFLILGPLAAKIAFFAKWILMEGRVITLRFCKILKLFQIRNCDDENEVFMENPDPDDIESIHCAQDVDAYEVTDFIIEPRGDISHEVFVFYIY